MDPDHCHCHLRQFRPGLLQRRAAALQLRQQHNHLDRHTVVSYPGSDWFAIGQVVNENRPFTGLINDVAVYNAALTQAQILAIYNAGSGGVCQ